MFKDKLKELREKKNISQYELAEQIFVSRSAVAKWENGLGMPGKDSLDLLCGYFNVTKEELIKEEDPITVLNNVQKKSILIIRILIIIISAILLMFIALFIGIMVQENYEDNYTPQNGMYYSDKYLEKFELKGLEMIEGKNYLLMGKKGSAFYSYIDSYEVFEEYVRYVYDILQYSPKISYLSFSKKIYNHGNPYTDYYLFPSNHISDHITETFENGKAHVYSFYYITNYSDKTNLKEAVNVNHIELQFLYGDKYTETDENWFKMVIENDDDNQITNDIYLANQFYEIEEIILNNENINDYLIIKESPDKVQLYFNARGLYLHSPKNPDPIPPFHLFAKVKVEIKEKESSNIVGVIVRNVLASEGTSIYVTAEDFGVESLYYYDIVYSYEVLEKSTFYKIKKNN